MCALRSRCQLFPPCPSWLQRSESRSSPLAKTAVHSPDLCAEVSLGLRWGPPSQYLVPLSHPQQPHSPATWPGPTTGWLSSLQQCQLSHLPFQDTPHHRFRADRAQAPSSKSSGICVTRADGIFPDSRASTGALWVPSCLCIGILDTAKLKSLWPQYWEFWTGKHLFFSECHKQELPKSPCRADAVPVLVLFRSRGYAHLFGHGKVQANCLNLC